MLVQSLRRRHVVVDPVITNPDWFFEDAFAGGQLNPANGFLYSSELGDAGSLEIVAAGDAGAQVKAGFTHALRATYAAVPLGTPNHLPQLNFTLPAQYDSLLGEFDVHIPANYNHRNNYTPPSTPETDNNKFITLWGGPAGSSYSVGYHQVACELHQLSAAGTSPSDGVSWTRPMMRWSNTGTNTDIGPHVPLIGPSAPMVPGNWSTVQFLMVKESSQGASDGRFRLKANGVVVHDLTGLRMGASDPAKFGYGLEFGYLFGTANAGFTEQTVFHLQRLRFAATLPEA